MFKKLFKRISTLSLLLVIILSNNIFAATNLTHKSWTGDPNEPYIGVNNNKAEFTTDEIQKAQKGHFIELTKLDKLGRCGPAMMCVDLDKMPKEDREGIGNVTPSGWKYNKKSNNNKYPNVVPGNYIFNRSHLLAFVLSGLNDEKKNLITGTRYLNTIGMLPFESDVASYVKKTGKHVLYRVTPIFLGNNLIAEGVQMEAYSIEDNGTAINFNVFCPNIQNGIEINYLTGENWLESEVIRAKEQEQQVNTNTAESNTGAAAATGGGVGAAFLFIIIAWFVFKGDNNNNNNNNNGMNGNNFSGYTPMQGWNGNGPGSSIFG